MLAHHRGESHATIHDLVNVSPTVLEAKAELVGMKRYIHDLECGLADFYAHVIKDGFNLQCKNCEFVYPRERIPLSWEEAPELCLMIEDYCPYNDAPPNYSEVVGSD